MAAIPGSGELMAQMINTQLGRAFNAQISLATAATGGYATINTASPSYPNGSAPHAMSEWYGYNHSAASYTAVNFTAYSVVDGAYSCSLTESVFTYYRHDGTGVMYTTSGGPTVAPDGYYTAGGGPGKSWYYYVNGLVVSSGLCSGGI